MLFIEPSTGMFEPKLFEVDNQKTVLSKRWNSKKFNEPQVVIENGIKFTIRFLRKMSDEYRGWSKNPFVSSDNRTPRWRIF